MNGLEASQFQPIRKQEPGTPESNLSPTRDISGSPCNNVPPTPFSQKEYQDCAAKVAYPLLLDQNNPTNVISLSKIQTSLDSRPNMKTPHNNLQEILISPLHSPKSLTMAFTPGPASSLVDSNTCNFTAAAHRAVADLFPELADTCSFEANITLSEDNLRYQDTPVHKKPIIAEAYNMGDPVLFCEADVTKRSVKRKWGRGLRPNLGCFKKLPSPEYLALKESPDKEKQEKIHEHREPTEILPTTSSQTALFTLPSLFTTTHVQRPKTEQLSQPSPGLVKLGLESSYHFHPFNTKGEFSQPTVTISPRYLSKLQLPLTPPKKCVFDFEEGYYESEMKPPEEGEPVTMEDSPNILGIGTGFEPSRSNDSRGSSLLSVTPPATTLHKCSLPIPIPASKTCSFNYRPTFASQDSVQCSGPFFSPEGSPCSSRLKSRSKDASRSKIVKNPKELLKEQNQLLLRWRSQGISYKAIKQRLGIDEAESTLRGRLRTLTKPKNQRLRKPQWMEEDIVLLLEVVDPALLSVKWKQVSETIVALGGSYKFGPSTCKKQYMKLVENGRARPLAECITGR